MAEPKGHEQRDLSLKWVFVTAVALTAAAVVIHLALWGLLEAFMAVGGTSGQEPRDPAPAPMQRLPEARELERAARERLSSEGPTGQPGRRHIPIDQAIDRLVERGWTSPEEARP